jgi:hypothetical protein
VGEYEEILQWDLIFNFLTKLSRVHMYSIY